jgi:hypothetical protein
MSLQDSVNTQVAAINEQLADAQAVNLPNSAPVSFTRITDALRAAADAIDGLGGDSSGLRAAIAAIEDGSVDLSAVATKSASHLGATAGAIDLLINQSNFDGAGETE